MGRELQKKKNRSGIPKVRQNPKKTRNKPLSNAIIAADWDRKQTVAQNYSRLGLANRLNAPTGGVEKRSAIPRRTETLPEAKIVRDSSTGAIIRVLEDSTSSNASGTMPHLKPLSDPLNELDNTALHKPTEDPHDPVQSDMISSLVALAAEPSMPKHRNQSTREQDWIQRLIAKHGSSEEDGAFDAMARDGNLNTRQQTAGDIKRRVRKYLKEKETEPRINAHVVEPAEVP